MTAQAGQTVKTTCPYCGVGCGVLATPQADGSVTIKGDPDHPANFGRLCSKGSALGETLSLDDRLLYPEVYGRQTGWNEALDLVAEKFSLAVREHGPESVALYVSGQFLTEDYYVANKLMKGFIGSANIDTNSRLCMASSVAGHRRAFGSDTVPGTYEDLELADLIVLTGSNLAWCHPVLYQRIAAAKIARPHMKIVLIDPRQTMTADIADMHLAIKPDGDVALFLGLLAHLSKSNSLDTSYISQHVNGMDHAVAVAAVQTPDDLAIATGLSSDQTSAFFSLFANTSKAVTVYSQGVNQSVCGTDKVNAIINCHLATGRIGKPGTGPFSVTGQPNAMGGREVGGMANMLAAHMDIENAHHRDVVQSFWKSPTIASKQGLKAVDMFKTVADGRIKALWIMATNPVDSMPDADAVEAAIKACPFVVVSDVSDKTDTIRHAHVKLPAAAWGEKDGTVTNSERRISRQRNFLELPGDVRPDWWQLAEVAKRMGFTEAFSYEGPSAVYAEHAALSGIENHGSRDFDISIHEAIAPATYDAMMPFQWPAPKRRVGSGDIRFFAQGNFYTPDRKARAVPVTAPVMRKIDPAFPLTLNTGRVRDHWHTMTRTAKTARLSAHIAEPFCEIHPTDALALDISDASIVKLASPYGSVLVRALVTPRQQRGSVFVPMHWTDQFAAAARVDALVAPVIDPFSGQPASKNAAVSLQPFAAKQYGFAVLASRPEACAADYWALAKSEDGWRIELAFGESLIEPSAFARTLFGATEASELIAYCDANSGQERFAMFDGGKLLGALYLGPAPVEVSRQTAAEELGKIHSDTRARFRVIAGRAGADRPDPGAIVCSCYSVGVNQITSAIRNGNCHSVEAVGELTKAGTNCGSCRSEIRGLIGATVASVAAE